MPGEWPIMPADALDTLRVLNTSNLPHLATATVVPTSGARTGGALDVATPTTLFEDEPCRLAPDTTPAPVVIADQPRNVTRWTLAFRVGVQVPDNALVSVRGIQREGDTPWTRVVRVIAPMSLRAATSMARYACIDAGVTAP